MTEQEKLIESIKELNNKSYAAGFAEGRNKECRERWIIGEGELSADIQGEQVNLYRGKLYCGGLGGKIEVRPYKGAYQVMGEGYFCLFVDRLATLKELMAEAPALTPKEIYLAAIDDIGNPYAGDPPSYDYHSLAKQEAACMGFSEALEAARVVVEEEIDD